MPIFLLITALLLSSCMPHNLAPSDAPFAIKNDTVILDKTHLLTIKNELYQPSFAITGVVMPYHEITLNAPSDGVITLLIPKRQLVQKDTIIAKILPIIPQNVSSEIDENMLNDGDIDANNLDNSNDDINTDVPPLESIAIKAPFDGIIGQIHIKNDDTVKKEQILMDFEDQLNFEFVSILPKQYLNGLSIGKSVSLSLKTQSNHQFITGQITKIDNESHDLLVSVKILPKDTHKVAKGVPLVGHIDFGNLKVGAVVPDFAIADGVNLTEFLQPPHKPTHPVFAHIWVIEQDTHIRRMQVSVVSYNPNTKQFLVTGISTGSLLTTANLPTHADGLRVVVD